MTELPDPPDLFPFEAGPFRHRVGLRPVEDHDWLATGAYADALLTHRQRLLAERHDDVVGAIPEAYDASAETLALVGAWLDRHAPHRTAAGPMPATPTTPGGRHPIDAAGRLVAEDLCVMLPTTDGTVLGAASLCFPTRWRLRDKLGRPMGAIHTPVPRYAAQIGAATDKALAHLPVDGSARWRANWSLLDDPELHQPGGHGVTAVAEGIDAASAGERVWLRVERQTLRRLPRSGAALFTILVLQRRLASLAGRPDVLASLRATLQAMPDDVAAYKSITPLRSAVLSWIADRADESRQPEPRPSHEEATHGDHGDTDR
jgi:hypothetical protein